MLALVLFAEKVVELRHGGVYSNTFRSVAKDYNSKSGDGWFNALPT